MRYKSFKIKNYKGVSEIILDLHHKLITLVGLNESGKTTIMKSISDFYQIIKKGNFGDLKSNEEINTIIEEMLPRGREGPLEITLESKLLLDNDDIVSLNKKLEGEKTKSNDENNQEDDSNKGQNEKSMRITDEKLTICLYFKFENGHYQNHKLLFQTGGQDISRFGEEIQNFLKEKIPEIIFYPNFSFRIPDKITFFKNGEYPKETSEEQGIQNQWRKVFDDILKSYNESLDFQEHVIGSMDENEQRTRTRIKKMEGELSEKISEKWKHLSDRTLFKSITLDQESQRGQNEVKYSFSINDEHNNSFKPSERSTGWIWFFCFFIFTEFRKKRTKNILFLIDEPASNLHSTAQQKILTSISNLKEESLVVYSTHSHHLISPKNFNGTYIVENTSIGEKEMEGQDESTQSINDGQGITATIFSKFKNESQGSSKMKEYSFRPILDALDYKPIPFEINKPTIIVEGVSDWYLLKYMYEVILGTRDTEEIYIYPSTGASNIQDAVRLFIAWNIPFVTLFDGDEEGLKHQQKIKKEWEGDSNIDREVNENLENSSRIGGKILSVKSILGEEKSLDYLLNEQDRKNVIEFAFPNSNVKKVDKKMLSASICGLYQDNRKVTISEDTKSKFDKLFTELKKFL